ncbi:putative tricarboxylic transport membrane protein [Hydromonas duriensis]|uniref:Putative tricarboxylic transport membrane protein n=2 Tax=Hydromonas duriensis TaxID=1527608 RepID=A0A4V3DK19_9BURK|nr:putative tricarboxylic transport membrane protein [Hydromonas duriensis]
MTISKWMTTVVAAVVATSLMTACGEKKKDPNAPYEPKSLTMVAPSDAGGGWDKTARSITKVMTDAKLVNVPMTVENVPGASGAKFLATYLAKDVGNDSKLFVNSPPILINNLKKDGSPSGYKDVTPLAALTQDFSVLAVKADSPIKDIKELVAKIKADPTKVSVAGGSSPGSMDHLAALLPLMKSGVDITKVKYLPFDGGGKAIVALLGGEAEVLSTDASGASEMAKAGKIRILAISAPERVKAAPMDQVPTYKEAGINGAEFVIWRGVFGPKDMSPMAYKFWQQALKDLSAKPEWQAELQAQGWTGDFKNGEEFKAFLGQQEATIKELLTTLGLAK